MGAVSLKPLPPCPRATAAVRGSRPEVGVEVGGGERKAAGMEGGDSGATW